MAINYLAALPPEILLQASSGCINLSSFSTLDSLIRSMFSSGEQGFAYDPNDLSTMYLVSAGLNRVTSTGQPVGLLLDKSKGGRIGQELYLGGEVQSVAVGVQLLQPTH